MAPAAGGIYIAPVSLPQGATITQMTFYFKDEGVGQATAVLYSCPVTTFCAQQAVLDSVDTWPPGWGSAVATSFNGGNTIDNDAHTYNVVMVIPTGGAVWGGGVDLAYTLPSALATTQSVAVPPAAFSPFEDGYVFNITGLSLIHNYGPGTMNSRGWYLAPLHLPDGAAVTVMNFFWRRANNTTATATAKLQRTRLGLDNYEDMASISSDPGAGDFIGISGTSSIANNLINNHLYAYWVLVDLPAASFANQNVETRGIEIKYQQFAPNQNGLAVPLAGLRYFEDGYDFQDHGRHLIHTHGPSASLTDGWYFSPLSLPEGVSITSLTLYYNINTSAAGTVKLQRTTLGLGNYEDLASLSTGTGTEAGTVNTTAVSGGPIDNARYGYWIIWVVPAAATGNQVQPGGLEIDYSYPLFLPVVRR